ncbi:MAG: hypothetical protein IJS34_01530, partial [Alphaproteobacteria bacterium]|nr:hypothetical protein [Alphaproteobacteria bacterium]
MANNKISLFFKSLLLGIFISGFGVNGHAATLPAGYTELEYIESTGTQYIDTGVKLTSSHTVEIKFNTPTAYHMFLYGGRISNESEYYGLYLDSSVKIQQGFGGTKPTYDVSNFSNLDIIYKNDKGTISWNGTELGTISGTFGGTYNAYLFAINQAGSAHSYTYTGKIYYAKIWDNNTLVQDLVPAKNASGVIGMYDTVSGAFFTNAGSGTFTAGPAKCRNLFDGSIEYGSIDNTGVPSGASTDRVRPTHTITIPAGTYTVSCANGYQIYGVVNGAPWAGNVWATGSKTFTVSNTTNTFIFVLRNVSNPTAELDLNTAFNIQLEQGSAATEYVPFCANAIKIATTAYNAARFSPVVTELNNTIATIRSVVTNTINQTKAIADLQATKQTRPDETCPAGKKCLLVEDDAGQPHWYEIIESASRLPDGYTELEYIEGTGTQYIDTGYVPNVNTETKINFLTTTLPSSDAYMFHSSDGGDARVSLAIKQHLIFFGDDLTETTNRITLPEFTANTAYDITVNKDKAIVNGT